MPKVTKTKKLDKYAPDSDFVRNLEQDITAYIKAGADQPGTEEKFNELALRLFEYQYNMNMPYQRYCQKRNVAPGDIDSWTEIPVVPTDAFKEVTLCTFPPDEAVRVIESSGTKNQNRRSRVHLDEMGVRLIDLSYTGSIEEFYYPDGEKNLHALLLVPSPDIIPSDSSIVYGAMKVIEGHHVGEPEYFINRQGFDFEGLSARFKKAEETGEPVIIIGASFVYVHFFDYCQSKGLSHKLPAGSRFVDGAGYKGKSREVTKEDLLKTAEQVMGIPPEYNINCYGMTEVQAIFPDNALCNHVKGVDEPREHRPPAWARLDVVDADTFESLPKGETGLIRLCSLANINTVFAVQSDDLGCKVERGIECVGRATDAESRGCSIAYDELISAQAS
jgi:hypothetical protein